MNKRLIILLLGCYPLFSYSQNEADSILNEMSNYTDVQSKYLGPVGRISEDYTTAEVLNEQTTSEQKNQIFDSSNLIIKYYIFIGILYKNETLALEKLLDHASDTTVLGTRFGCHLGSRFFNSLLFDQYYNHARTKYYLGGSGMFNGVVYSYQKSKRKIWKQKEQELRVLCEKYLNIPFIEFRKYQQ
ncbi:MAG: hypothetical protein ACJAXV_001101 [Bacteroidia bacterium]|jgi:hypothetical protein